MPLIRTFFRHLGHCIGHWPAYFGFISFVLGILLSVGMLKMHLKDHIRDGYTPENAPSRVETAKMRTFWNASGDPMKAMVMFRSKLPDQNMLRLDLLTEVVDLNRFLMRQFHCSIGEEEIGILQANSNGQTEQKSVQQQQPISFTYEDLCAPFCEFNFGVELFVDGLSQAMSASTQNRHQNLSFPHSIVHSFKIPLELFFYGVKLRHPAEGGNNSAEQNLTNIHSIKMVLLTFYAERSSPLKARQLSIWEMAVFDYLQTKYQSDLLDVQVIGVEILDNEMTRDHRDNVHFFALGCLAMSLFVGLNIFFTCRLLGHLDWGKCLISSATVLCPLLAISSTFGALSHFGIRTNSFLLILPYLILGIGVDDGFLLMHRWFQLANQVRHPQRRLELVFSEVGPSITVTTLTNVISFGVGAFTPTPEIRLFCFGTALALSLDYALQMALFCPIMLFSARFEKFNDDEEEKEAEGKKKITKIAEKIGQSNGDNWTLGEPDRGTKKYSPFKMVEKEKKNGQMEWRKRAIGGMRRIFNGYCHLLTNKCFAWLVLLCLCLYWLFALFGSQRIQTKLDIDKILPRDSKMRETTRQLDQHVWANHLSLTVLVNGPLNVSSEKEMQKFWTMVEAFEGMAHSKGPESSLIWLRDYQRFFWSEDDSFERMEELIGELAMEEEGERMRKGLRKMAAEAKERTKQREEEEEEDDEGRGDGRKGGGGMDLCRLDEFLDSPFYTQWNAFLRIQTRNPNEKEEEEESKVANNESNSSECHHPPVVSSFILSFAFRDILGWDARIELMLNARRIASNHSKLLGLDVSVWEDNAMFVDQMLSLHSVTLQSGLLTLLCMALVCAFFVPNPISVLLASASICSISIGVFGFLSWFGFDLDPVTMAATLMSIGLSVDFTAHVIYHFRQDFCHEFHRNPQSPDGFSERLVPLTTRAHKLRYTLESVGWPMLQSGISTALCIFPLLFVRKYAPTVFVYSVFLVCGWGLLHGLLIVPCLLCLLPNWCSSRMPIPSIGTLRGRFFGTKGEFRVQDGGIRKMAMTTNGNGAGMNIVVNGLDKDEEANVSGHGNGGEEKREEEEEEFGNGHQISNGQSQC